MCVARAVLALSVAASCLIRDASAAVMCNAIGRRAPSVTTVLAAPNDTVNAAWILHPNCSYSVVTLAPAENSDLRLNCSHRGVRYVESLPSAVQRLQLENNPIPGDVDMDFSSYTKLGHVILAWCNLTRADHFKFPPQLYALDFDGNNLTGIPSGVIPDKLHTLLLSHNGLTSIANFSIPNALTELHLEGNALTSTNFTIPYGLSELRLDGNKRLKAIENVMMPNSLTKFTCSNCAVETFRGVQLSSNLIILNLDGSTLEELEIQESDATILRKAVFTGTVSQTTCKDPSASLRQLQPNVAACVISDDLFRAKYLGEPLASKPDSNSSSKTTIVIIVAIAAVLLIALGVVLFRRCKRDTTSSSGTSSKHLEPSTTAAPTDGTSAQYVPPDFVHDDIRKDDAYVAYRIPYDEIQIIRLIGKGGFGIVHLGRFRGQDVAVKQVLPDRAKNLRDVRIFMNEIRLYASLDHPRIVQFVGLMWSTLQDIAIVSEYMAGGDLHTALDRQAGSSPTEWFEASSNLKAKSSLALDVIVALVYLHSFDHPIIHRDLKARNVLLSIDGDAKLSDFGTSREALVDETMTGEIGTVAWIAPEVLRGERYNEKADMYSLGVLLVELDTARHPYRHEVARGNSNTQIALMVSTGKLAPRPSRNCPSDVAAVIASCLSYHAEDRPSAMGIHYELRKVVQARGGERGRW